jgi:hypothetical protein
MRCYSSAMYAACRAKAVYNIVQRGCNQQQEQEKERLVRRSRLFNPLVVVSVRVASWIIC